MKWLPNALTILRCILAFVVGWAILEMGIGETANNNLDKLLFQEPIATSSMYWSWVALIFFILAAVLDFLDGWLARRWNAVSQFGRLMDPIADKLLVALPLLALTVALWSSAPHGKIIILPVIVIIARDILITLMRFSPSGGKNLFVTKLAKWKTAFEFFAIGIPLVAFTLRSDLWLTRFFPHNGMGDAWLIILYLAAILSVYTGYKYVRAAFSEAAP